MAVLAQSAIGANTYALPGLRIKNLRSLIEQATHVRNSAERRIQELHEKLLRITASSVDRSAAIAQRRRPDATATHDKRRVRLATSEVRSQCPNCQSHDIERMPFNRTTMPPVYQCPACKHVWSVMTIKPPTPD